MLSGRTLIESKAYAEQLTALGGAERLDDILRLALWALTENPEVFDIVKGFKDIRLLKTDAIGVALPFRIWFRIDEGGEHVHLEYIEAVEESDS